MVEDIEQANRERYQNQSYNFGAGNRKLKKIICYSQHVDHQEPVTYEENETNDDLYKLRASICHQGPPKLPDPTLNRCKYNVHVEWETAEKTHEPLPVLQQMIQLHVHLIPREMAFHILMVGKVQEPCTEGQTGSFLYSFTKRGDKRYFQLD